MVKIEPKGVPIPLLEGRIGRLQEERRELSKLEILRETQLRDQASNDPKRVLLAPPSEKLLRYEAHLDRLFDRTLSRLERLQRTRRGQPVPPPIEVKLSA